MFQGWKSGSVFKTTGCSYRGLGFGSLYPHSILQPLITPVPGDRIPFSGLLRHQALMWHTYINAGKTHKNKILKSFFKKKVSGNRCNSLISKLNKEKIKLNERLFSYFNVNHLNLFGVFA